MKNIKKGKEALICIFLLSLTLSCSQTNQIESPMKNIMSNKGYVNIQGRWKKISGNYSFGLPRINTVNLTCEKETMTCKETIAELVSPKEEPIFNFKKPQLFIFETTYEIITWTDEIIYAKYSAPVADFELTISIKDNLAERHWRETKARGVETSNPKNYGYWILE